MNLLIDLAHKNRKQSCDSHSTGSSVQSSSASPRRLRRNNNKFNLSDNNTNSCSENSTSKSKVFCLQKETIAIRFIIVTFLLFSISYRLQLSRSNVHSDNTIFSLLRLRNLDYISGFVCRSVIKATSAA